jgi:short-subunit dehydrogenase
LKINFFSMVRLHKLCMPHLAQTKGHLVAVSSMMGRFSTQQRSGYTASKHALQGFMDSVRLEVTQDGVHVMVVSPGFVRTEGSVSALTADGTPYGKMDAALAAGRAPEDVAEGTLAAIEERRRDYFPAGPRERFGFWLSRHAPSTLDRILLRSEVK